MKQGTFDVIDGIPIVFAYVLSKPKSGSYSVRNNHLSYRKALKKYESSRQEWEVDRSSIGFMLKILIEKNISEQVEFTEIQSPTKTERGKCKITKIL
ncbi:unnamed protein product [marine sediment metagenome]|uniref:Uncharacterized protein n=1 Tax=marine sediment metagenome TaxID=412755 RepID=X1AM53_9ZZZZ